jgi:hypothetical protein
MSYDAQCSDMITVKARLEFYKVMCTEQDNCFREAMSCISQADFTGMVLPQGAIDVSLLPMCM